MSGLTLEPELLDGLARVIAQGTGLHFAADRWPDLVRGVSAAASSLHVGDPGAWARRIAAGELDPRERQALVDRLTIGETYFLRDPASFEVLEREILPRLLEARAATTRSLAVWSAGCSTGEEAYSLAISCLRAVPGIATWQVLVLGTDVNESSLARARRGVYGTWSFRGAPDWLRADHFRQGEGQAWAVGEPARSLVRFVNHNLAWDPCPPAVVPVRRMDVIFCRNVVMYLTPEHQRQAMSALHDALADDGVLLLSAAEGGVAIREWFEPAAMGGTIVYRKAGRGRRPAAPPTMAPPPASGAHARHHRSARRAPEPGVTRRDVPATTVVASSATQPPASVTTPAARTVDNQRADAAGTLAHARALADQGRLGEAAPLCEDVLRRDPGCASAAYLLATIRADLGDHEAEAAALRLALEINPEMIVAHRALGALERRRGRPAEARRHFRAALATLLTMDRAELVPEADGITAGRLAEAITRLLHG